MKKKVCFFGLENLPVLAREFDGHGIGGEQVQQTLLARALRDRGYQVSMVTLDYGQTDGAVWDDIQVFKAYKPSAGLPLLRFIHPRWTGVWSALGRANADIYYTSCAGMHVGLAELFCKINGRGFVFRLASNRDVDPGLPGIRYFRDKKLYIRGLVGANAVLSQHGYQQQMLMENFGVSSELADMLVDPSDRELLLAERDISMLWVNNLRDLKRPDLAIELARRLPKHGFHIVGGPQPGFPELYEAIKQKAVEQLNVTFHGRVPYHDVGDFYDRARVFVNTSDTEGFPNSYLQSWRRGVPVVAFFDPDGLIRREGLGYAVNSMEEMTIAVQKLLIDDDEWHTVSARCLNYMVRQHHDDLVLKPYISAIEKSYELKDVR